MKTKLAIFDLDGVLAKTTEIHSVALRSAVEATVSGGAHQESYLAADDGIRTIDKLMRLAAQYGLEDSIVADIDASKKEFTMVGLQALSIDHHLIDAITLIKDGGYMVAVASNSRRIFVDAVLEAIGVIELIDFSVTGDEVLKPKPSPEIFNKVIQHFGIEPTRVFIFEDSPSGMEAALASGAIVIPVDPHRLVTADQFALCK